MIRDQAGATLWEIAEEMSRLGLTVRGTCLTGGGARSGLWREIMAAILGCPVWHSEGDSTLGDAIVAAVGLGVYPDLDCASQVMVPPREIIPAGAG
jgi:xylulokinase